MTEKPLTRNSLVGRWLDHPAGGDLIRGLLTEHGMDITQLTPARGLPLGQVASMSQGALTQTMVDDLVLRANGGVVTAEDDHEGWREQITPGRFDGRTVIVTGAGSGIGRAVATRIVGEGGRVVAVDINTAGLAAAAEDLRSDAFVPVTADITRPDDVDSIVAAAQGRVDGLANIAGVVDDFSPIHETTDAVWERCFAVNVDGMFRLSRAVVPLMLEASRGAIVNVASEAGLRGNAAGAAYTASKYAVVGLTQSTAFMYGLSGLRTNAVAPGGVATGMQPTALSEFGSGRLAPFLALIPPVALPQHLAASITFLLSDDAINLNGVVLPSDGGWSIQ